MASNGTGNRRGSSIFAASAAEDGDVSGPYGRPAYLYGKPDGNLLVDFPQTSQSGGSAQEDRARGLDLSDDSDHYVPGISSVGVNSLRSSSVSMNSSSMYDPMGGQTHSSARPRRGEAARMEELANSQDLPGGPNHRPLVGGFAAAAYEAAKAHHYSMKRQSGGNDSENRPRDRPPPPSI